jgi:tungstate transport system permease protein
MTDGVLHAFELIFSGDPALYRVVARSLMVTLCAVVIAGALALPFGYLLVHGRFAGRGALVTIIHTLTAVPTVVVGLVLFSLLSRSGPLGELGWLYTPTALVLGQALLAFPIIATLVRAALASMDVRVLETARALGAGRFRAGLTQMSEGRLAVTAALVTGFGRVVGEVGCAMMVGGNIEGYTRTMSTAIALESGRGEFAFGLGLGLVLLLLALLVNMALQGMQGRAGIQGTTVG